MVFISLFYTNKYWLIYFKKAGFITWTTFGKKSRIWCCLLLKYSMRKSEIYWYNADIKKNITIVKILFFEWWAIFFLLSSLKYFFKSKSHSLNKNLNDNNSSCTLWSTNNSWLQFHRKTCSKKLVVIVTVCDDACFHFKIRFT